MSDLGGRRLDRYEVLDLLGAGGMGSVYRARDCALKRTVAIKVLLDAASEDPHRLERFNREIRSVARLSHPNIVKIHDFGSSGGVAYAVMELLEGRNLRDWMHGKPLPLAQALPIGVAIANGLSAAHHEGILHRDIKPENIFLTAGNEVKILDFGLARTVTVDEPDAETRSREPSLTLPGTVVGTTSYMSPEQTRGLEVDARSDIFSLGCVLYEMLSGSNPFRRETHADTMSAILHHDPPPLSELRPTLSPALELIVARCLAKDPDQRFESARDVAFALLALSGARRGAQPEREEAVSVPRRAIRWLAAALVVVSLAAIAAWQVPHHLPAELPADKRIALIPFEAPGGDADLGRFAAGVGELIASQVAFLEQRYRHPLWIVPTDYGRREGITTPNKAYRVFNANVALTGTIRRRGPALRLQLAALDPRRERTIRSTTITENLGNVSSFQSEPFLRVAEMLDLDVPADVRDRVTTAATNVPTAFDSYVRGLGALTGDSEAATTLAVSVLEEAIRQDATFCAAREALARALAREYRQNHDQAALQRAFEQVRRVLERRPSASACEVEAELYRLQGDHARAIAALERAVRLASDSGAAHYALGSAYRSLGRSEEAERELQRAAALRPGYWPPTNLLGALYLARGDYDAAANAFREVTLFAPEHVNGYNNLGAVYQFSGHPEQARAVYEKSIALDPDDNYAAYTNLGSLYFDQARFADAAKSFRKALDLEDDDYRVWGNLAFSLAFSAEPETAHDVFLRAVELGERQLQSTGDDPEVLSKVSDYYAMIHDSDASLALLKRVIALDPQSPLVLITVAETFEDLGDREHALAWVERALAAGAYPQRFARSPSLRSLIDDERYRRLVQRYSSAASPPASDAAAPGDE